MKLNKYWFKPKIYGYGSYPVTWEGWVTIVVSVLILYGFILLFLSKNRFIFYASFLIWIIAIVFISYIKTDGKWKWRWG